jgi:cytochrome c oxidase subunit IV
MVEEKLHTLVLYLIFIALVIDCLKFIEDLFGCCQHINLNCSLVTIVIILNVNILTSFFACTVWK